MAALFLIIGFSPVGLRWGVPLLLAPLVDCIPAGPLKHFPVLFLPGTARWL